MAKKKSAIGTILRLGGLAAAAAAVYYKREEIKSFLVNTLEKVLPDDAETEPVEELLETEPEIVIDTVKAAVDPAEEAEKTEEAEESAPEE